MSHCNVKASLDNFSKATIYLQDIGMGKIVKFASGLFSVIRRGLCFLLCIGFFFCVHICHSTACDLKVMEHFKVFCTF